MDSKPVSKEEVARAMELYGGSFMSNIGKALYYADIYNTEKIKQTWPEEWAHFTDFVLKLRNNART